MNCPFCNAEQIRPGQWECGSYQSREDRALGLVERGDQCHENEEKIGEKAMSEQIAALAAELARLGKMPIFIDTEVMAPQSRRLSTYSKQTGGIWEDLPGNDDLIIWNPRACLAALLGIAAEVVALGDICIRTNAAGKLMMYNWDGDSLAPTWFESYPEAVIAALKTIETEGVKS